MFLAAIDDLFQSRVARWGEILAERPTLEQATEALVAYEAKHQGEFGFYRVVFTALVEADDPEIRAAIATMYGRFHQRLQELIDTSRRSAQAVPAGGRRRGLGPDRAGHRLQHHPRTGTARARGSARTCSLTLPSI